MSWQPLTYAPGHAALGAPPPAKKLVAEGFYSSSLGGPGLIPSYGLLLAGSAAIWGGQYLPGDYRTPATLAGLGLAGYGAYGLYTWFFGTPEAHKKPVHETMDEEQDLDAYRRLTGTIVLPARGGGTENTGPATWPFKTYKVAIKIRNLSDKVLKAYYRLEVDVYTRVMGEKSTDARNFERMVTPGKPETVTVFDFPNTSSGMVPLDAVARLYIIGIKTLPWRQVDSSRWTID